MRKKTVQPIQCTYNFGSQLIELGVTIVTFFQFVAACSVQFCDTIHVLSNFVTQFLFCPILWFIREADVKTAQAWLQLAPHLPNYHRPASDAQNIKSWIIKHQIITSCSKYCTCRMHQISNPNRGKVWSIICWFQLWQISWQFFDMIHVHIHKK